MEESLSSLEGVVRVKVDASRKAVTVAFDPERADLGDIRRAVESAGFRVGF